jgi:hypothetical protein
MTTAHNGGSTEAATQDGNLLEIGARDQKLDAVSHGGLNIPGEVFDEARQQTKDEAKKAKDDARFAKATARFAKRRAEIIAALASKTDKPEHREAAAAAAKKADEADEKAKAAAREARKPGKAAGTETEAVKHNCVGLTELSMPVEELDAASPWFGKVFYDGRGYWVSDDKGGWFPAPESGVDRVLRDMGQFHQSVHSKRWNKTSWKG